MPSQYIVVHFPQERVVYCGGVEIGFTNQLLGINGGTHTITLDDPQDYTPPEQVVVVAGTSVAFPLELHFALSPPAPPAPPAACAS